MKIVITEREQIEGMECGWGNGYVAIPVGHVLHGKSYVEIHEDRDIEVHGGLTYSDYAHNLILSKRERKKHGLFRRDWMVGFDTGHWADNSGLHDKAYVRAEAQKLHDQLV